MRRYGVIEEKGKTEEGSAAMRKSRLSPFPPFLIITEPHGAELTESGCSFLLGD
jgi:hypothetical protein